MPLKLSHALIIAAALAMVTPVSAQQNNSLLHTGKASAKIEAADQTLGMALLGAVVNGSGALNTMFSTGAVSSVRNSAGVYSVKFDRVLIGCTPVATPLEENRNIAVFGPIAPDLDTWDVLTNDLAGADTDSGFTLLNFCAR